MENVQYNDSRILDLIPDGVLTLDQELTIRQCNPAACRMLGIQNPSELIGTPVSSVLEDAVFQRLRDGEETQCSKLIENKGGDGLLECSCQCDGERDLFVCVLRGTEQTQQHEVPEELLRRHLRAVELADAVCEKQLNIVSEIASLLGETAVETQAAVQEFRKMLLPGRVDSDG